MKRSKLSERVAETVSLFNGASPAERGHLTLAFRDFARREQGVGTMRERRAAEQTQVVTNNAMTVAPELPEGAMVLVPMEFDDCCEHSFECLRLTAQRVRVKAKNYGICTSACPRTRAYLDELRKRGQ